MKHRSTVEARAMVSPFDPRCRLHIDRNETAYWIEFHEKTDWRCVRELKALARFHGLVEDDGADEYDMLEDLGNGILRLHLVTVDTFPDVPLVRSTMPDLSETAYGPLSGPIPAVKIV